MPDPVGEVRWEVTAMDVSRRHRRALVSLWLLLLLGAGAAILGIRPDEDYGRSRALAPQDPTVVLVLAGGLAVAFALVFRKGLIPIGRSRRYTLDGQGLTVEEDGRSTIHHPWSDFVSFAAAERAGPLEDITKDGEDDVPISGWSCLYLRKKGGLLRRTLVVLEPGTYNRAAVTAMVRAHLPVAAVPRTGLIRYIHV